MENLEIITRLVCDIAREAGSYIRKERAAFSLDKVERKHAHDYVSYVDKGSERLIVSRLREVLPEAGFITEEGTTKDDASAINHQSSDVFWVVDPLDGTTNFIHGFAPYAVSIALLSLVTLVGALLGGPVGVPVWYGELLNRVLTCPYVYFDAVRYMRNESEVPSMNTIVEGLDSFVFTQSLRKSSLADKTIEEANQVAIRRVDSTYNRIDTEESENPLIIET